MGIFIAIISLLAFEIGLCLFLFIKKTTTFRKRVGE